MTYETPDTYCASPGCISHVKSHEWGKKEAQRMGWFFQKDGTAWCARHIPDWVEEWRARKGK